MRSAMLVGRKTPGQHGASISWGARRAVARPRRQEQQQGCPRAGAARGPGPGPGSTPGGGGPSNGGDDRSEDAFDAAGAPPAWRERLPPGVEWKVQWQFAVGTGATAGSTSNSPASNGMPASMDQAAAAAPGPDRPSGATSSGAAASGSSRDPGFKWTRFDRGSAVRAAALADSGWDEATFEARLDDLAAVLPDLRLRLPALQPALLLAALRNPRAAAAQVVTLKAALPGLDVGALILCHPPFLDPVAWPPARLAAGAAHAAAVLGSHGAAEGVLQWYPPLLDPELLDGSVAQLRRLVPHLVSRCLPPGGMPAARDSEDERTGDSGQPQGPGARGRKEPDSRELVHLLGIVMKSAAGEDAGEGGPGAWWEESPGSI